MSTSWVYFVFTFSENLQKHGKNGKVVLVLVTGVVAAGGGAGGK